MTARPTTTLVTVQGNILSERALTDAVYQGLVEKGLVNGSVTTLDRSFLQADDERVSRTEALIEERGGGVHRPVFRHIGACHFVHCTCDHRSTGSYTRSEAWELHLEHLQAVALVNEIVP